MRLPGTSYAGPISPCIGTSCFTGITDEHRSGVDLSPEASLAPCSERHDEVRKLLFLTRDQVSPFCPKSTAPQRGHRAAP